METVIYVKFQLNKKERIWLKVDYIDGDYIHGTFANDPITSRFKFGDNFVIHRNLVLDKIIHKTAE